MPENDPDVLDSIIERTQKGTQRGTADRLDEQRREAPQIKAQEEAASQSRLEEMWLREHDRQRAIARAQAEQRRQEQMLVRYVLIGAAIIVLIVIALAIAFSLFSSDAARQSLHFLLIAHV